MGIRLLRNVIIYRHQLFRPSEGFIVQQTKYLTQYHPVFAGRIVDGTLPNPNLDIKIIRPAGYLNLVRHVLLRDNHVLHHALMHEKPALIHAHFGVEGVYALPLAKKLNIPLITTFHGFDATCSRLGLLRSKKISWLNYLAFRQQLGRDGAAFICVSNFIRDRLLRIGFPENRLITHYIGVDTDLIKPVTQKKAERIILHVARLVEKKGTAYLLKAFSILQKKGLDAKLVIIGDGPLKQELHALATSLDISHQVEFLGVQPPEQVIAWMQKASLFCLPSIEARSGDSEAMGMVLLEAAACQIPVVATNHGGIPEGVKEGETGFLVAEKNPYALAERLIYLLENESLCEKMGLAAREFVERDFNLKLQTEKLEQIYQNVN